MPEQQKIGQIPDNRLRILKKAGTTETRTTDSGLKKGRNNRNPDKRLRIKKKGYPNPGQPTPDFFQLKKKKPTIQHNDWNSFLNIYIYFFLFCFLFGIKSN